MDKFRIRGGRPLEGAITIGGNSLTVEGTQHRFAVVAGDHHQLIHQSLLP